MGPGAPPCYQVHPPGTRSNAPGLGTLPWDQVHPLPTSFTPIPGMHPPDMASAADGTVPTGMHSCSLHNF